MIYVQLQSGKEYLFIGDAAWHMDNIRLLAGKNAPWIVEDTDAVMAQLKWLGGLLGTLSGPAVVLGEQRNVRLAELRERHFGGIAH